MKILLLDIECAPNVATIWGLFNQNIGINQILEANYILCWAAKWLGEDVTYFDSVHRSTEKQMLKNIHELLDEADAVVHYNGRRYDMPMLNRGFVTNKMAPPAPYKQIDLLSVVRSQFRFPSNKLQYVAKELGLGQKQEHAGHELWLKCMVGDKQAWDTMEEYNIQDVFLLEALYDHLLPWIPNHPNHGIYAGDMVCPNCGGTHFTKRGFSMTHAGKYQRYQCRNRVCGKWFRDTKNLTGRVKFVTTNV